MKLKLPSLFLGAALALAFGMESDAQQANLTTPETISATNIQVQQLVLTRTYANITVEFQAADTTVKRVKEYSTASNAELLSFVTAIENTRATETGSNARKLNFRILGWLFDNGKIKDEVGATISVSLAP